MGLTPLFSESEYVYTSTFRLVNETITFDVNKAVKQLKSEGLYFNKDIKRLDSLSYNIIYNLIEDSIANKFVLNKEELTTVIQAIAISEGSIVTKKGCRAFQSSLFLKGNNPFGIKGKGNNVTTVEYYKGVRHVLKQNFQSYSSFKEALNHLLKILLLKRYTVNKSKNNVEFFYSLKKGGYFTAPNYHKTFFIPYSNKLKELHLKNKM